MQVRFIDSIHQIDAAQWNSLCSSDYPFARYEFLAALEDSGCTSSNTGWQTKHLLIFADGQLFAAMPGYIKATPTASMYSIGAGPMPIAATVFIIIPSGSMPSPSLPVLARVCYAATKRAPPT